MDFMNRDGGAPGRRRDFLKAGRHLDSNSSLMPRFVWLSPELAGPTATRLSGKEGSDNLASVR
jgi:hypothetical protein